MMILEFGVELITDGDVGYWGVAVVHPDEDFTS
jgi:hypothetical protein